VQAVFLFEFPSKTSYDSAAVNIVYYIIYKNKSLRFN